MKTVNLNLHLGQSQPVFFSSSYRNGTACLRASKEIDNDQLSKSIVTDCAKSREGPKQGGVMGHDERSGDGCYPGG